LVPVAYVVSAIQDIPSSLQSATRKFRSRSHDAAIRVYDDTGNVIETNPTEKLLHLEIGCAFSLQAPRYCGSLSVISSHGARSSTKV
jgi:hypothetical protein